MDNKSLLTINLSRSKSVVFYQDHLLYAGQKITYADLQGLAYFVGNGWSELKLYAAGRIYEISVRSEIGGGELYRGLARLVEDLIKPVVAISLLLKYAAEGRLAVGALVFSEKGIGRKKLFGGRDLLPWDEYHSAVILGGNLTVHRKKIDEDAFAEYYACPASLPNASLVPAVVAVLAPKKGRLDEQTLSELIEKRNALLSIAGPASQATPPAFCWSCGNPIEPGHKYCTNCGSRLL